MNMRPIDAIDAISHCLQRLKLISGFIANYPTTEGDEGAVERDVSDSLYFSLVAIENDLQRALDGLSVKV